MNRWSKWTRQLRDRHARTERSGGPGMVFQRRLTGGSVLIHRTGSKLQVSVNPRIGITLMASAAAPLPAMRILTQTSQVYHQHANTQQVLATFLRSQMPASGQQPATEPVREGLIDRVRTTETTLIRTLPRFLPAPVRRAVESEVPRVHRMIQAVSQQLPVVRAAKELPAQLRLRARREELRPAEMPQIVNAARAAAAPSPGHGAPQAQDAVMTATHPVLPLPPVPPPLNVEALTSQVIQQIDRRLIAYRERMGRG